MLELNTPLAFIDLETTGINVNTDRIVEIAIVKLKPDNTREVLELRINPTIPIPAGSTAVHGISNEDVANAPTFKDEANRIKQFLDNCDLAGFNSNRFDIPLLVEEFMRAGLKVNMHERKMVDVAQIFMKMEKRTLEAAFQFYCGKKLENAHSALADVNATIDVLLAQVERYDALEGEVDFLHDFSKGEDFADFSRRIKIVDSEPVFNFGKYKDQSVKVVFAKEPQYYDWMMRGEFAQDTKAVISEIFNKLNLRMK
jgi:DNA polymerase III subunit epsilon